MKLGRQRNYHKTQAVLHDCEKFANGSFAALVSTFRVEDTRVSSSPYCSSLMLGLKASPWTERPHRILVDTTYLLCKVTRLEARLVLGTGGLLTSGSRSSNSEGSPKSQGGWTSVLLKPPWYSSVIIARN